MKQVRQSKQKQQMREEAENRVRNLKKELETKKKEVKKKQAELQQLQEENQNIEKNLQSLKNQLENKNKEDFSKEEHQKNIEVEREVESLKEQLQTKEIELQTKVKEFENEQAEVQQLQEEIQRMESNNTETDTCLTTQSSAATEITVEVDQYRKSIRLRNQSHKEKNIQGWTLILQVNNKKPLIYTFESSSILQPGETFTLWLLGYRGAHSATDRVWFDLEPWNSEDKLQFTLITNNREIPCDPVHV
ncbi:lamin-A-like [Anabas testudineus]|uniref:lamin-A-like n=1 Tax=Anabas testudineus TaxID=64144 RepID=UPI00143DCD2B|nr:lamin-A-like [Anabas testudineus]